MKATSERVNFRYIVMPCCNTQLCWVNPRLPSFCPECGNKVYMRLKTDGSHVRIADPNALLRYHAM